MCVLSCFSHVQLFATLWTVAHQAPLSMGFSRQVYWSGLPFSPPGDLWPKDWTRVSCHSCIAGRSFTAGPPGKPIKGQSRTINPLGYAGRPETGNMAISPFYKEAVLFNEVFLEFGESWEAQLPFSTNRKKGSIFDNACLHRYTGFSKWNEMKFIIQGES